MRRQRELSRLDLVLLLASAVVAGGLAVARDQKYRVTHGRSPSWDGSRTHLPTWMKARRHDAIRLKHTGAGALTGLGLGLSLVTFRPRPRPDPPTRRGAGDAATAVAGLLTIVAAARWIAFSLLHGAVNFYGLWYEVSPRVSWGVLGAWAALVARGAWRGPVDVIDRLGRWLGACWLALGAWQGVIYVLAWS